MFFGSLSAWPSTWVTITNDQNRLHQDIVLIHQDLSILWFSSSEYRKHNHCISIAYTNLCLASPLSGPSSSSAGVSAMHPSQHRWCRWQGLPGWHGQDLDHPGSPVAALQHITWPCRNGNRNVYGKSTHTEKFTGALFDLWFWVKNHRAANEHPTLDCAVPRTLLEIPHKVNQYHSKCHEVPATHVILYVVLEICMDVCTFVCTPSVGEECKKNCKKADDCPAHKSSCFGGKGGLLRES